MLDFNSFKCFGAEFFPLDNVPNIAAIIKGYTQVKWKKSEFLLDIVAENIHLIQLNQ